MFLDVFQALDRVCHQEGLIHNIKYLCELLTGILFGTHKNSWSAVKADGQLIVGRRCTCIGRKLSVVLPSVTLSSIPKDERNCYDYWQNLPGHARSKQSFRNNE